MCHSNINSIIRYVVFTQNINTFAYVSCSYKAQDSTEKDMSHSLLVRFISFFKAKCFQPSDSDCYDYLSKLKEFTLVWSAQARAASQHHV